jgi:alkylated DNA repair dioxygenase AlkB
MLSLFPLEVAYPEGFEYLDDFITKEEEVLLLHEISHVHLHTFNFQGYEAKRKVASFGYDWNFENRTLTKGKDFPPAFSFLVQKVASHLKLPPEVIGELLVTEYPPGSVINWHRDAPPFDVIAGISINTDCTFKLRPHEKSRQGRGSVISIPVRRRSLYIMAGEVRSTWQHSIAPVKAVRYSITLRTLREPMK